MRPEAKYNYLGKIKKRLQKYACKHTIPNLRLEFYDVLTNAVIDVIEYENIILKEFWCRYNAWDKLEKNLFETSIRTEEFYRAWNNEAAEINICANTVNQLLYPEHYEGISHFFTKKGLYVDFGCGTAALSLGLLLKDRISGKLILLDVPNDVNKFVNYRIKKHQKEDHVKIENVLGFNGQHFADGVICIDVLEHLENPSEVFINRISPILKKGGFLALRAPWRGHLTHLDDAPEDFYRNGGRKYLADNYRELFRFDTYDICCIYQKIK